MQHPTRRAVLLAGGATLASALAGCLATDGGTNDPGTTTDGGDSGTTTGGDDPVSTTTDGSVEYEVLQLGGSLTDADWNGAVTEVAGDLVLLDSPAAAQSALDLARLPDDRRETVESFVSETDFGTSVLLHVASVGPNTCYSEVQVGELDVDDSRLVGTAQPVDTSGPDQACGEAITYPAALVRVTVDGPVPTEATLTITNGWGTVADVTATTTDSSSTDPDDLPGYVRPDGDPAVVPAAPTCDDDSFERHPAGFDEDALAWGETTGDDGKPVFALRVDDISFARGDEVQVSLTNVTGESQYTGNRHKYNLQVYTESGWQDVRGYPADAPVGYTDEAVGHRPGDGFDWRFTLDPEGVVADQADRLSVCPGLPAGRYRFVFWEPAVAVAFDLVE